MITEYNKILLENYTTTNSILFNLDPAAMWHSVAQHGKTLANTFANPSAELWQHHALPGAPLESPDLPPGGGCSREPVSWMGWMKLFSIWSIWIWLKTDRRSPLWLLHNLSQYCTVPCDDLGLFLSFGLCWQHGCCENMSFDASCQTTNPAPRTPFGIFGQPS